MRNRLRLRKKYKTILQFNNAKDIHVFLKTLTEKERNELFAYTYKYAILQHQRDGIPVTEYFLLHYDEFIPNDLKGIYDKADVNLSIIFVIVATVALLLMLF